jgi:hypothetical protein
MVLRRKFKTAWGIAQSYLRGWCTRRKIVVLESDDWGNIRTPSREVYDRLSAEGYDLGRSHHSLDALETDEDLDRLFEVLGSVRDACGRPACMTPYIILANPDFEQIRRAEFQKYFYEPVTETLARSDRRQGVLRRWTEGRQRQVFIPQLHAREHVAWWRWLEALRGGSVEAHQAFEMGMCGLPLAVSKEKRSYDGPIYVGDEELRRYGVDVEMMVREGVDLFVAQLGYAPLSVTAPNYQWTAHVERIWRAAGVRYIHGAMFQHLGGGRRRIHYLGQASPSGCCYLIRNCFFEPAAKRGDVVGDCLREVARAFRWHKPAVIGTHRYNYIGAIDPANRVSGLRQLSDLLQAICRRWPNVRFLSSPELGRMIEGGVEVDEGLDP